MGIKEEEAKLAEWIKTGNDAAEAAVDKQVNKLSDSRYTAIILGGVCFAALIIIGLLVAF